MTSNMLEYFNNVLKGVYALSVIAIVEYIFQKLNEYFQKHSMETTKLIAAGKKWPHKIEKWMVLQKTKLERQTAVCFSNNE